MLRWYKNNDKDKLPTAAGRRKGSGEAAESGASFCDIIKSDNFISLKIY